ncbi:hypothetical protein BHE74_00035243 [Ensete ventricosum]|nr:hypothetical protein BHE74_00035243 [Ensete ventricosum]
MVDIAVIHLEGDAIQWYNWFEHTQGVPTWRQFKSGLLIRIGPSEYENIDDQLTKIRRTSTIQENQTSHDHRYKRGCLLLIEPLDDSEEEVHKHEEEVMEEEP